MSSEDIRDGVVELAWSLWTELGVPGVSRHLAHTVIDPEPLLIATPTLAAADPRLLEQVFGWCTAHAQRISNSRLKGLLAESTEQVVARFSRFSVALRDHGVKWPVVGRPDPYPLPAGPASPLLPMERPSLLRFRLRALCGVGARADVLCELLTLPGVWRSAADLARLGYTKRNVARVLSELGTAGIVVSRKEGNALRYLLRRPRTMNQLVEGGGLAAPSWRPLLGIVLELVDLLTHEVNGSAVRRVEANKLRERLVQPCHVLGFRTPPVTRGVPEAWDELLRWGSVLIREIAAGDAFPRRAPVADSAGSR